MNEFTANDEAIEQQPSPPPRWKGARSIGLAHQLNEQCIELLCDLAAVSSAQSPLPFVAMNRDLWRGLEISARKRLAVFPFVIVDLRFKDDEWWRALGGERSDVAADSVIPNGIPSKRYEYLLLETLMFAWQAAREDRHVAQMVFSMTPSVASRIAALAMQQIRTLAVESTPFLRIRWDDDSRFWRELLIAAREADEEALGVLRHHAKLLFCGELIGLPRTAAPAA